MNKEDLEKSIPKQIIRDKLINVYKALEKDDIQTKLTSNQHYLLGKRDILEELLGE